MERPSGARGARTWRHPAFAAGLAALALVVLSSTVWSDPPPTLGEAFAHLFGAWIAIVFALWRMSSALGIERGSPGGRRHE